MQIHDPNELNNSWTELTTAQYGVKTVMNQSFYCFENVSFKFLGDAELVIQVIDKAVIDEPRIILQKQLTVISNDLPVHSITLDGDFSGLCPMGSDLRILKFSFLNINNIPVYYVGEIRIIVTCDNEPNMIFQCHDGNNYITEPNFSVKNIILFYFILLY